MKSRIRFFTTSTGAALLLVAGFLTAPAAVASDTSSPDTPETYTLVETATGLITEVPDAYLAADAPEWVEYASPPAVSGDAKSFRSLSGGIVAAAVGETCTKPLCGQIRNTGSATFTVSTDYVGGGQVASGSRRMSVAPGVTASYPYDWDAVWIPAGWCGTFWTGVGYYFRSTDSRVGLSTGTWHKVDDLGADAKIKSGSCA